jgi:hypothetical protein
MRLTEAIAISEMTIDFLAQSNRRPVLRLSDVGATSVKTLVQAMLLHVADQYQLEIATGRRTVADFKGRAASYGVAIGGLICGGCLPDEIYDRVVKENPDPERLKRALISAGHESDRGDAFETETAESFYSFLTSLDPLSPTYWPAVYDRLGLPFHSDTVPPYRINIDSEKVLLPDGNVCATATKPPERPKRGFLASIFGKPLYLLDLSQERQRALFAFADSTHREMGDLVASGRTTSLPWAGRKYFEQRLEFIRSIRERFQQYSWVELTDYNFSLLAAMVANYVFHHQCGIMPRDAREVDLLEQVLTEMCAVGPKRGRWSVERAIDGAMQQLRQQLRAANLSSAHSGTTSSARFSVRSRENTD